jgi:hypothetical protein
MHKSYRDAKMEMLSAAGLIPGQDMPGITLIMAEGKPSDDYHADKPSEQLRSMADCMERYTREKVAELRKLADHLDRTPDRTPDK